MNDMLKVIRRPKEDSHIAHANNSVFNVRRSLRVRHWQSHGMQDIQQHSSLQLQLLSRISQIWLPVDSKSTDPTFDPCLGHFRIYSECCHQVL